MATPQVALIGDRLPMWAGRFSGELPPVDADG